MEVDELCSAMSIMFNIKNNLHLVIKRDFEVMARHYLYDNTSAFPDFESMHVCDFDESYKLNNELITYCRNYGDNKLYEIIQTYDNAIYIDSRDVESYVNYYIGIRSSQLVIS